MPRLVQTKAPSDRNGETHVVRLPDGRRLLARSWPGRGEPVVLLHGMLDSSEGWADFCHASHRTFLALDLPGFGGSDLPSRPRISAYAEDVCAALDELGVERFALVGHSLGGAVAAGVAERMPDRVTGMLLLAPAGFGRIALAEAISIPGVRNLAERVLPIALSHRLPIRVAYRSMVTNGVDPDEEILGRLISRGGSLVPGAVEATRAVVAAGLSERGFHRRRVRYHGPVTALWGLRDRLVPSSHRSGAKVAFPHAKLLLWAGMAHHPQREHPARLHGLLAQACPLAAPRAELAHAA